MITSVLNFLDLLHCEVELSALCDSKLVLKGKRTRWTSIEARNYDYVLDSNYASVSKIITYLAFPLAPIRVLSYRAARIMAGIHGVL